MVNVALKLIFTMADVSIWGLDASSSVKRDMDGQPLDSSGIPVGFFLNFCGKKTT